MAKPQPPPNGRKTAAPWDRLRPAKQDPLEAMGFVSKGDSRLLDIRAQESFYQKIVTRYMQFCSHHRQDLDSAFASLSLADGQSSPPTNAARNPTGDSSRALQTSTINTNTSRSLSTSRWASSQDASPSVPNSADEISTILTALRKLREALLATSASATSPTFAQRVHVFNIRLAILALHPPSYHPSLLHLLTVLHTAEHPLPESELREMTGYMVLDLALRQNDLVRAYALKHHSKKHLRHETRELDLILHAVVTGNWIAFWRTRQRVGGYVRAMMYWHIETVRKQTLKVFGRAYLKVDEEWLLKSTSGNEMDWSELVAKEDIGWSKEGGNIVIRKPKTKS